MSASRRAAATRVVVVCLFLAPALGAPADMASPRREAECAPDVRERLAFLEQRLDDRRTYADRWWKIWTATYGTGTIVQSVRAGLEDDTGERADYTVGAVKALYGTVWLLRAPPTARRGADAMRAVATTGPAGCAERLQVGERLLRENAREAESRWSWKRHLANVAINVAGGVIVAEGFDESDGWISAGIGIAVGEAMTWSRPWRADDDLVEYEHRFDPGRASRPTWHVSPWGRGVRVGLRF